MIGSIFIDVFVCCVEVNYILYIEKCDDGDVEFSYNINNEMNKIILKL